MTSLFRSPASLCGSLALLLAGLLLLPATGAHAQTTTASLEGVVTDEAGETLPGASVLAVHQPTGTRYGASTNANGRYRILNMRVGGPYTITVTFVGYRSRELTDVTLQLDTERALDVQLSPEAQELDAVEVTAERNALISANRTGTSINISEEQIDRLPTISRSLGDFARLIPQATGSGGANSIAGRNDRYNSIQIDGATLNDVFGLGDATPGSQAGAEPISLDAIEEFNVEIAPYDVRSSGFTGGLINAITKSGSNEFDGSLRFRRGSEQFTGDLDGIGTGEFGQSYYVGTLGGPIIEDKLFFFINGELKREQSPLDTRVGTNLGGVNIFNADPDVLEEISTVANDVYGYDTGGFGPLDQREDDEKFLAKLDWNVSDDHRLTLRHNYVNARDDAGIGRGEDSFGFSNRQYVFRSTQNSTTAQLNSTFGANAYNEARLVYTRLRDNRDVEDQLFPEIEFTLDGGNELFGGIGRFNQANRLNQDLYELANDFTYAFEDHTLTLGTQNQLFRFENLFIQDFAGSYTFAPFEYVADGDTTQVSAAEAFERGQPSFYQYSYATPEAGVDQPVADFTAFQVGVYAQDEWQVNDDFRVTGGLRLDVPVLPEEPTFNRQAFEAFGRSTSNVASGNLLWSPRFGFNYGRDLLEQNDFIGSTQLRGGVGIFSGNPPFVWISNQYSNTGADLFRLQQGFSPAEDFVDDDGNYDPEQRFVPVNIAETPTQQPRPGDNAALTPVETTEINVIADDFTYPQTLRTNLAVDQELPSGFVATLEGLYSNTLNDVTFRNLNIEQVGVSAYGRPLYDGPVSDRFTNVILLDNTNEGYEYSLTGQIQRRVAEGFGGSASYTYNRAQSVNSGTSSRAISNWTYNENFDTNNPGLGTPDFEVRHRLLGTLNYNLEWGRILGFDSERLATSFGVVYEGRSGEPFSWIYNGNANGDTGQGGNENDLVFVPDTQNDVVLTSGNWDLLDAFIDNQPALEDARGGVVERGSARGPWQHIVDLRLAQQFETFEGQRFEVIANVENFLNMLNEDWGRIRRPGFNNEFAWGFERYIADDDVGSRVGGRVITANDVGKPVIDFQEGTAREALTGETLGINNIFSRWRARLGIRYTF